MAPYTLYHNYYSVCSIMLRYTIANCGANVEGSELQVTEKEVDIQAKREQLSEHYLTKVNRKGLVPVLADGDLASPLPDSLAITRYLAQKQPHLIPAEHANEINQLLDQLHSINFFSLSFTGKWFYPRTTIELIQEKMKLDISDEYRKALEYKLENNKSMKLSGLEAETVQTMELRAKDYIATLDANLGDDKSGPWLFGLRHATALDSHVVPFLARMEDVGRGELLTPRVQTYLQLAQDGAEWKGIMQGRSTMYKH